MTFPPQKLIDSFMCFRARHYDQGDSLFQQLVAPGDLFVIRNVANLVPPSEGRIGHHDASAALEFGVRNLGVEHIIVLGHAECFIGRASMRLRTARHSDFAA